MRIVTPVRGRLFVALLALAAALLLAAACSSSSGSDKTPASGQTPAAGQTPADDGRYGMPAGQTPVAGQTPGSGATAEIKMVAGTAFDKDELTIPADTQVTITADNTDGFHSFAVYESEDAAQSGEDPVAETEPCGAPCKKTVDVTLAAGEHYFRCEVHPSSMNGVIVAE